MARSRKSDREEEDKFIGMTVDELQEFFKCASDPEYWMLKYCFIKHPRRGKISFDMFDFQKTVLKDFVEHQFNVTRKPRQMGVSWTVAAYALHKATFKFDQSIQMISIGDREAKKLLKKCKYIYQYLPRWMQIKITNGKKGKFGDVSLMEFENGSFIESLPSSEDAGRSEALSLLVMDEVAFIKWAESIWAAAYPTLSTGGQGILISTCNGVGNLYHRICSDAEISENEFNYIKLDWRSHPERWDEEKENQILKEWGFSSREECEPEQRRSLEEECQIKDRKGIGWYDKTTKALGPRLTAQEIDCDFLTSGDNVFDMLIMEAHKKSLRDTSPLIDRYNGNLKIYEKPQIGKRYVMGIDVASGHGRDFSAFVIMDLEGNEVCEYRGKHPTRKYAKIIYEFGKWYGWALAGVEINGIGYTVIDQLQDMGYPCIYNRIAFVRGDDGEKRRSTEPGWVTSSKTRPVIIDGLEQAIRDYDYIPKSKQFVNESYTFIWNGTKPEAMESSANAVEQYNDDTILCRAIAWKLRQDPQAMGDLPFAVA